MGLVFDIKHYAIHDGPGIRTTVFLKGCPLNCPWCHNPESKRSQPEFMWKPKQCLRCQKCVEVCPENALTFNEALHVNESICTLCGACVEACYPGALELVGKDMTVNDVMAEILKDQIFHMESNGGVTFSGGEPFSQPTFLKNLLKACKKSGIHTAVDTCGYVSPDILEEVIDFVDLWLYDLKHMDDMKHLDILGVSNQLILENLKRLNTENVIIRLPLIPGFNDDLININSTGHFLQENGFKDVCILPYHTAGSEKRERLNTVHQSFNVELLSEDAINCVVEILRSYGLSAKIGG